MDDALTHVVIELARGRAPAFEWVAAWSDEGVDPLEAAWIASREPVAMVELLVVVGEGASAARVLEGARAWVPVLRGMVASRARAETVASLEGCARDLRAGRRSMALGRLGRAMERWPVAREALCVALRAEARAPTLVVAIERCCKR